MKDGTMTEMKGLAVAINVLQGDEASLPAWVELVPPGTEVTGRDGRQWLNDQPQAVVDAFIAHQAPIPIDAEHSTEHKAPQGEQAPAMAWIEEMEVRDGGSIWGRTEWTPRGKDLVMNREYRFLSPVFIYEKSSSRIKEITSAGLTNRHNLYLHALNQQGQTQTMEKTTMKKIYSKLGLAETATEDDACVAIDNLQQGLATAKNQSQSPDLAKFVPRADYDQTSARAVNAEQKLKDLNDSQLTNEIDTEITAALTAGKITPATKDYHVAQCRQEGGLARFKDFVKAAPAVAVDDGKAAGDPAAAGKALNAEERQVAGMFGNSAEDLKKYGA